MKLAAVLTFPATRRRVARVWLPFTKRSIACLFVWAAQGPHAYLRGIADDVGSQRFALGVQRAERTAFWGTTPTEHLQSWLFNGHLRPHDWFFAGVHAAWFFLPLGLLVWIAVFRWSLFWSFAAVWLATLFVSDIGFFMLPTEPPWMALPVERILVMRVNGVIELDTNPLAAMPSLHVGLPATLAVWFWLQRMRAWALAVGLYVLVTAFAVVYMGEHYAVDVLAAFLVAVGIVQGQRWIVHLIGRKARGSAAPDP